MKHKIKNLFFHTVQRPAPACQRFFGGSGLDAAGRPKVERQRAMPARNHVELVVRTFRVLEALVQGPAELRQIAARTGLGKSTAFRILYTLKELGYVEQAGPTAPYALSWKMTVLARRAGAERALAEAARPHLVRLRNELDESVWLAELRRDRVVITEGVHAAHKLRLSLDLGDACPLHASALGKSVAAWLPESARRQLLGPGPLPRFTRRTITSRTRLNQELEHVRKAGYAVNDEETVEGAFLTGAPIFDAAGRVCAALSVSAPKTRLSSRKRRAMIAAVRRAAAQLSRELFELGYVSAQRLEPA